MTQDSDTELHHCLAYVVLEDYENWLGAPSPHYLEAFLDGAEARAAFTGVVVPPWRLSGPLNIAEFYLPLVARTGNPSLSIRWANALDLYHFSLDEAMRDLRMLFVDWVSRHGLRTSSAIARQPPAPTLSDHLRRMAERPGMYFAQWSGWSLRSYLAGLDRGGDWLGLPPLPGLREVVDGIEEKSLHSYGSRFGAYRVYEHSPEELLSWVGIAPE